MSDWLLPTISQILDRVDRPGAVQSWRAEACWQGALRALAATLCATQAEDDTLEASVPAPRAIAADALDARTSDACDERDHRAADGETPPDPAQLAVPLQGLVLVGPLPLFGQDDWADRLSLWTFSAEPWQSLWQLPAAGDRGRGADRRSRSVSPSESSRGRALTLLPADPLAEESFCLALTPQFSLVMALGSGADGGAFQFSFDPAVVAQAWRTLRGRAAIANARQVGRLDALYARFAPVEPHYSTVVAFSQRLLQSLPEGDRRPRPAERPRREAVGTPASTQAAQRRDRRGASPKPRPAVPPEPSPAVGKLRQWLGDRPAVPASNPKPGTATTPPTAKTAAAEADVELLQAIAHGVRTPLATIRMLTRLLMKRRELGSDVMQRLAAIDRECTEQIDRFDLIFKAVELETDPLQAAKVRLTATSLDAMLKAAVPRWQERANRHRLTLTVDSPQPMPAVVCDPAILDRMLTELIEGLTRRLPAGSHIQLQVTPAGNQLKLQLHCQDAREGCLDREASPQENRAAFKSVGQLLAFQPETGSLTLNLNATKNLFQMLGGKLAVRQRSAQGEVFAIFLPLQGDAVADGSVELRRKWVGERSRRS